MTRLPALSQHFNVTEDMLARMSLRGMVQYVDALNEIDARS